jgi:hypothetical protein
LVYFTGIWWPFGVFLFGIFSPVLVCCTKKSGNPAMIHDVRQIGPRIGVNATIKRNFLTMFKLVGGVAK